MIISNLDSFSNNLSKQFSTTQKISQEHVLNAIKVALLKTTRCPQLEDVLEAYGKEEVEQRLEDFSVNYKSRI